MTWRGEDTKLPNVVLEIIPQKRSKVSSVGIATGYGLDDREIRVRLPVMSRDSSPLHKSSSALGPTQTLIQWISRDLPLGVKQQWREAHHSPPSTAEVKNGGDIPPLPKRLHSVVLNELSIGENLPSSLRLRQRTICYTHVGLLYTIPAQWTNGCRYHLSISRHWCSFCN
jgi:hypothetical protein